MAASHPSKRSKKIIPSFSSAQSILQARMKTKSSRLKPEVDKLNLSAQEKIVAQSYSVPVMSFAIERNYIDYGLREEDRWWSKEENKPETSKDLEFKKPITLLNGEKVTYIRKKPENLRQKKEFYIENESGQLTNVDHFNVNLLPLYNIETLEADSNNPVIICEGIPATDALTEHNFKAVGTFNATDVPSDAALKPLINKQIYLWPDNDDIGVFFMVRLSKRLKELGAKQIKVIKWENGPWRGDAANFEGTADELQALIDNADEWSPRLLEKTDKGMRLAVPHSPYSLRSNYQPESSTKRLI